MPMDGVALGFLARELAQRLAGGRVDKVTQPERDEINLTIRNQGETYTLLLCASANYARAHITQTRKTSPLEPPMLCMLMRKHLVGGRVTAVRQIGGDRVLHIDIENDDELGERSTRTLVLEIMGKHSNLMMLDASGRILECVHHVTREISRVREVLPGLQYEMPPAQDKLSPDAMSAQQLEERLSAAGGSLDKALTACVMGVAAATARELAFRVAGDEQARVAEIDVGDAALRTVALFTRLPAVAEARLLLTEDGEPLDFCAFPFLSRAHLPARTMPTLSAAMDAFYGLRDKSERISQKGAALLRVLRNNIERCEKNMGLHLEALQNSERMEEYRMKGELLMAHVPQIPRGAPSATVINYYEDGAPELVIDLDVSRTPAQNAQRFFKQYQKAKSARFLAAEQLSRAREELAYLEGQLDNLRKSSEEAELNEIREELSDQGYVRANHNRRLMKKLPPSQPYHYLSSEGADVLVGKNNQQNDRLTQSADGDETWLHVKDMPGSHVVLAHRAPTTQMLREAALLAAYFSKGRGSSQVPVDYTLRKHVKKPGGAKPGYVIYTHQHTLYVTPSEDEIKKLRLFGANEK